MLTKCFRDLLLNRNFGQFLAKFMVKFLNVHLEESSAISGGMHLSIQGGNTEKTVNATRLEPWKKMLE